MSGPAPTVITRATPTKTRTVGIAEVSLEDYARAFEIPCHPLNQRYSGAGNWATWGGYWTGDVRDLSTATRQLTHGWTGGAARLESMVVDLDIPPAQSRRRRASLSSVDGYDVDIDRVFAGDPECWRSCRSRWVSGSPVIELWGLIGGSAAESAESLFWNGAATVVATDILEQAGYSVRVVGTNPSYSDKGGFGLYKVAVKEAGEPVRTDVLASVFASAGTFRKHGFRLILALPVEMDYGYGTPIDVWDGSVTALLREAGELPDNAITVNKSTSRDSAILEVRRILRVVQCGGQDR